jgi:hypothetical protein
MRRALRILPLIALACAAAGAYNVFADQPQLEGLARARACGPVGQVCKARLARIERTPFRQRFVYSRGGADVQVDCQRSFIFVGDYDCAQPVPAAAR